MVGRMISLEPLRLRSLLISVPVTEPSELCAGRCRSLLSGVAQCPVIAHHRQSAWAVSGEILAYQQMYLREETA